MITSRIVRCPLPSPPPVAPPVRDAPLREGLVEVPLAGRPAPAERVPLVLAPLATVAAAAPALREEPRAARRATALSVASIVRPTQAARRPEPAVVSPRLVAHRGRRVVARTATAKESSVLPVATTAMIVPRATSVARAPQVLGAALHVPRDVLKAVAIVATRVEPSGRHVATRVVPTRATPGHVSRAATANAVPTTVTRARAVVAPVVAHRVHRESRVAAVPSTLIAPSAQVARWRRARVATLALARDAHRAN
jgi:hypothetical protein